jgi:hypothetical protein
MMGGERHQNDSSARLGNQIVQDLVYPTYGKAGVGRPGPDDFRHLGIVTPQAVHRDHGGSYFTPSRVDVPLERRRQNPSCVSIEKTRGCLSYRGRRGVGFRAGKLGD